MPPWVKRQIEWTLEARASVALLRDRGHGDVAVAATEALERFAATGKSELAVFAHFRSGPWRGYSRLKEPAARDGWRIIFLDYPARRRIVVQRVRLRPDAYLDPSA